MMAVPSERCYISELPEGINEDTVKGVFGAYGNIKTVAFFAPKRAAIIQFQSVEEAKWVVENLNGNIAQGLPAPVKVGFANPQGQKGYGKAAWGAEEKGFGKQGKSWGPYGGGKSGGWSGGLAALGDAGGWGGGQSAWSAKGQGGWENSWDSQGGKGKKGGGMRALKKGLSEAGILPGGKWSNDENALFVGGLPTDCNDGDLYAIFSPFGAIPFRGVRAMQRNDGSGLSKGFGFVNFLTSEAAENAIKALHEVALPDGTALQVMTKAPAGPVNKGKGKDGEGDGQEWGKSAAAQQPGLKGLGKW